jgi:hypothetical protein
LKRATPLGPNAAPSVSIADRCTVRQSNDFCEYSGNDLIRLIFSVHLIHLGVRRGVARPDQIEKDSRGSPGVTRPWVRS